MSHSHGDVLRVLRGKSFLDKLVVVEVEGSQKKGDRSLFKKNN